ncbi:helix-turn-helix domain-containing protein [Carnobacterium maltaromaticum]|uniref:helix-turn-helix domain-containing protein n=1 Tax=Carnobacterium maltaromaticum TaxID=2751 RepID=UPI00295ED679|nr:helix-turn-helix domain-containing protein [Carnobacterium maltaromaticum]
MNRLMYKLITDKQAKRQVRILLILSSLLHPISLEELSEKTGVSERTLSNDLISLSSLTPVGLEINIVPRVGISLTYDPAISISNFILEIAENNSIFIIIDDLFTGKVKSIREYSERLFISETALRKKLSVLKKNLREYKLSLSLSPLMIKGDEYNIRCFFFMYYKDTKHSSFITPNRNQISVHAAIIDILKEETEVALYTDYIRASHWLNIVERRIKNGFYISLPEELIIKQMKKNSYRRFKEVYITQLAKSLKIKSLNEDEVVFAFLIRMDTIVYRHTGLGKFILMYEEEIPKDIINPFLELLFSEFNLTFKKDSELFELLKAFLTNSFLLNQLTSLLQKNSFELNQKIKNTHPMLYKSCLELVIRSELTKYMNIEHFEDFSVRLTLILSTYVHNKNLEKKRVLFSLTGETAYLDYFIMLCNCYLPRNMDIYFSFDKEITPEYLIEKKIDVWIHNYHVQNYPLNIISYQISSFPTFSEWSKLLSVLIGMPREILHSFLEMS